MSDLTAKFTALEQQITTQHTATMGVLNAILAALQAVPPGTVDLAPILARLTTIEETLANFSATSYSGTNVLINRVEQTTLQVAQLRDLINTRFGAGTDDAPSVLAALDTLIANTACLCDGGQPPSDGEPEGCANPIMSTGIAVMGGRTYVTWDPPPEGLLDSSEGFPQVPAKTVLTPADYHWSGWSLWVSGPTSLYSDSPSGAARYATRAWRDLVGEGGFLCVSVPGEVSLRAWLCPASIVTPATCYDIGSLVDTLHGDGGYSHTRQASVWPAEFAQATGFPFGEHQSFEGPRVALMDAAGWTASLITGSDIRVYTASDSSYLELHTLHSPGDTFTFTTHSTRVCFDDWQDNNVGPRGEFLIQFCRPSIEGA